MKLTHLETINHELGNDGVAVNMDPTAYGADDPDKEIVFLDFVAVEDEAVLPLARVMGTLARLGMLFGLKVDGDPHRNGGETKRPALTLYALTERRATFLDVLAGRVVPSRKWIEKYDEDEEPPF